jgi:hypothetical protein
MHEAVDRDEEELEENFTHIWAVLKSNKVTVPGQGIGCGCLVWVRKDLVQLKRIRPEDCHQVSCDQRVEGIP